MLGMGEERPWTPPVVLTAAADGQGIDELWEAIAAHRAYLEASGLREENRRDHLLREVEHLAAERLRSSIGVALHADAELVEDLARRRVDPYRAVGIVTERLSAGR
jgi:LAO/AO transport system kinase